MPNRMAKQKDECRERLCLCSHFKIAFLKGYEWHKYFGQHLFVDSEATFLLENEDEKTIYNAMPKQQWNNRPGNA